MRLNPEKYGLPKDPPVDQRWLRRVERLCRATLYNAIRLHADAIYLHSGRRYASAVFLSVMALEEMGKAYILNDLVFQIQCNRYQDKNIQEWLDLIYMHVVKHDHFISNDPRCEKQIYDQKYDRWRLERLKQSALHVGYHRIRKSFDLKRPFVDPKRLGRAASHRQISLFHTHISELILGVCGEYYSWESDFPEIFNKRLLRWLSSQWKAGHASRKEHLR